MMRLRCCLVWIAIGWLSVLTTIAQADQTAPELDALFEQLAKAPDSSDVLALEGQIWQLWLKAPDRNGDALMSQIVNAMRSGQLTLAIKLCDQLIDSSPNFAEAWNKRATLKYLVGEMDASVSDINETIKLEPRHFGAISGLGMIFLQRGDLQSALDAFEQVLEISPKSPNTLQSVERVRSRLRNEI